MKKVSKSNKAKPRHEDKLQLIIEVAVNRLAYFGVHKTTLTEIAEDAGVSKQALHYYFTDKQSLLCVAIKHIGTQYINNLQKQLSLASNIEAIMGKLVDTRYSFYSRYHMLFSELHNADSIHMNELEVLRSELLQSERNTLAPHFSSAMDLHEMRYADINKIIKVIQETLDAFSHHLYSGKKLLDHEYVQNTIRNQKEVMQLFYRGMRA